jgi:hypothetical protein
MKRILQAMNNTSTKPIEGANDMAKLLTIVEGKGPLNRLTTAESMAVEQYTTPKKSITNPVLNVAKDAKPSMIGKYFKTIEEELAESSERNKDLAKSLAERIASKINETPIAATDDPNDPMIHGHEKANPMTLKGRIQQARNQLKELASMAESDDLVVWEQICKLAKGGMFMGLEQNMEQIRHGISELAAKRKKGGVQSRGIDKNIGEEQLSEDWQKVNKQDKTDGMSRKAVKAYRRENPGSTLKTAVTTKPSKLKKGSKSAKRRASFCARMSGMKKAHASAKTKRDPDSPINKALRRWNCESIEEMRALIQHAEQVIAEEKQRLDPSCWDGYKKQGTKMKGGVRVNNCVPKEDLRDPEDNPCWKGYKPVGTKQKGGRTVPNCVPKEAVQKTGPAGQLKGKDKVDVKGTVLGSPEKSQKGLRGKLVGGGSA